MGDSLWATLPTGVISILAGAFIAVKIFHTVKPTNGNGNEIKGIRQIPVCPSEAVLQRFNENAIKEAEVNKNLVEAIKEQTKMTRENCTTINGLTEAVTVLVVELKKNSRGGNNG